MFLFVSKGLLSFDVYMIVPKTIIIPNKNKPQNHTLLLEAVFGIPFTFDDSLVLESSGMKLL